MIKAWERGFTKLSSNSNDPSLEKFKKYYFDGSPEKLKDSGWKGNYSNFGINCSVFIPDDKNADNTKFQHLFSTSISGLGKKSDKVKVFDNSGSTTTRGRYPSQPSTSNFRPKNTYKEYIFDPNALDTDTNSKYSGYSTFDDEYGRNFKIRNLEKSEISEDELSLDLGGASSQKGLITGKKLSPSIVKDKINFPEQKERPKSRNVAGQETNLTKKPPRSPVPQKVKLAKSPNVSRSTPKLGADVDLSMKSPGVSRKKMLPSFSQLLGKKPKTLGKSTAPSQSAHKILDNSSSAAKSKSPKISPKLNLSKSLGDIDQVPSDPDLNETSSYISITSSELDFTDPNFGRKNNDKYADFVVKNLDEVYKSKDSLHNLPSINVSKEALDVKQSVKSTDSFGWSFFRKNKE